MLEDGGEFASTGPVRDQDFTIQEEEAGRTLAALLRARLSITWGAARALCESGKVFLDEHRALGPEQRLRVGQRLQLRLRAPAPAAVQRQRAALAIVHEDSQIVVVDKPSGVSSVPFERGETGTAMDLVREAWRGLGRPATRTPLHVVHRLDKESSGLLLFAKTRGAERALQSLWRAHDIERRYLCVAHGHVVGGRIESHFISDRGDGLRGSLRPGDPRLQAGRGKRAVSHVRPLEALRGATLCEVRIETGKTHQIRIHLSESGHPLLGERVYVRDHLRRGGVLLGAPRLMLHAETLGFRHPATGERVLLRRDPPSDFTALVARLRP